MTGDRAAGRLLLAGLAIMFVIGAGGCRRDGRVTCTGSVTYAGAPVERGVVGFVDDATRASEGAVIENGRFTIRTRPGSFRVQIRGARPLPPDRQPPPPAPTCYEDFIPEQFNTASTLTVEVRASGPHEFTFDLTPPPER